MLKLEQIQGPCQNCKRRCLGCHGKCKEYQKYRTMLDTINEMKFKEKSTISALWKT